MLTVFKELKAADDTDLIKINYPCHKIFVDLQIAVTDNIQKLFVICVDLWQIKKKFYGNCFDT